MAASSLADGPTTHPDFFQVGKLAGNRCRFKTVVIVLKRL